MAPAATAPVPASDGSLPRARLMVLADKVRRVLATEAVIESVRRAPLPGLYEVVVDKSILYVDEAVNYVFQGSIHDVRAGDNHTAARLSEVRRVPPQEWPLDAALKVVKGDGSRTVLLFEDPHCGYCKQMRRVSLQEITDVTIYTVPVAILGPESADIVHRVWCSADPMKAWDDWMLRDVMPALAKEQCETPEARLDAFRTKWRIESTPTIVVADGRRVANALAPAGLDRVISEGQLRSKAGAKPVAAPVPLAAPSAASAASAPGL